MELKLVIDGLGAALDELKQGINDLSSGGTVQHNELLSKLDSQAASLAMLLTESGDTNSIVTDINGKLDAVHTMLSHLADTQAAHGVQLNAIMAALYASK